MGLFDKAKDLVADNKDAVEGAIDKAADVIESKTPDSMDDKVEQGAEALKNVIDKLD